MHTVRLFSGIYKKRIKYANDLKPDCPALEHSFNQWEIRTNVSADEPFSLHSHSQSWWSHATSCWVALFALRKLLSKSDLIWSELHTEELKCMLGVNSWSEGSWHDQRGKMSNKGYHINTPTQRQAKPTWTNGNEEKQNKRNEMSSKNVLDDYQSVRKHKVCQCDKLYWDGGRRTGRLWWQALENNSLTRVSEFWGNRRTERKTERRKCWNKSRSSEAQH